MKGIDKITSVRLAESLTERGAVSSEVITDALYTQDKDGEPFVQVLVNGGHITEWDLAKLVAENFNLPFLMAGNYQISEAAQQRFPVETLFKHMIVPLDSFGDIVTVAMPVMLPFDQLAAIQREHNCDLFPYVGLITENKKILGDMFKGYHQWIDEEAKRRECRANSGESQLSRGGSSEWMSIFNAGDQAIQKPQRT